VYVSVCVCVCECVRARVIVSVCVCVKLISSLMIESNAVKIAIPLNRTACR
jgi:hypothetical protein